MIEFILNNQGTTILVILLATPFIFRLIKLLEKPLEYIIDTIYSELFIEEIKESEAIFRNLSESEIAYKLKEIEKTRKECKSINRLMELNLLEMELQNKLHSNKLIQSLNQNNSKIKVEETVNFELRDSITGELIDAVQCKCKSVYRRDTYAVHGCPNCKEPIINKK